MFGFMLFIWFLFMWVSNIVIIVMMILIVGVVLDEFKFVKKVLYVGKNKKFFNS